ncbi:hypothetical protein BGW39_010930 [Mortierella sp. 14UC]|nr:hypothetical protein BGW39_010930 [Mortierella sp. 14UC]
MRFNITILALVTFIAPSVVASDGADHTIIETNPRARTCNNKAGGFNSGNKTKGQSYQRVFPFQAVVNYKDCMGANCVRGGLGTIFVGPRPAGADPNGSTIIGRATNP